MKKKFLLPTALFAVLAFSASNAFAAPPSHGGGSGGYGGHKAPSHMHRPPMHNHAMHHSPRHHHYVRHYSRYYSPYYYDCYFPLSFGFSAGRYYYPTHHHGNFGAHFHISI